MRHFFYDSLKRFLMAFVATLAFVAPTFAAILPAGYMELEYIESDGNAWIDTGLLPSDDLGYKFNIILKNTEMDAARLGVRQDASTDSRYWWGTNVNTSYIGWDSVRPAKDSRPQALDDVWYEVAVNYMNDRKYIVDNNVYISNIPTLTTTFTHTFPIFATRLGDNVYQKQYKLRYITFTRGNSIIQNLVPAKNSSGVIGMYDTANGGFYTNRGTGTFTAGPTACPGGTLETRHESGLPVGYTKLDYIQSDGNSWIDTGIKGNMSYKYDIEFQQLDVGQYRNWGAFNQETYHGGSNMSLTWSQGFAVRWTVSGASEQMVNGLSALDTNRHHLVIDNGNITWDGVAKGRSTGHQNNYQLNYNLFLGTINPGGTTPTANAKSKYYSYKVWNTDGNLIQNFVPAKNSSNVIGMYDLVSGQFFTNAGTGTFTAGNSVSDPIVEQCVAGTGIKIATTKYTEDAFAGLMTTLSEAITKVTNIVDTTVQQATEIGNLATTKQDRPDTDCPAGRKCLLIMGADNKPHWYLIQE